MKAPSKVLLAHLDNARWLLRASSTESSHWFHAALSSRSISRARAPSTFARISTM